MSKALESPTRSKSKSRSRSRSRSLSHSRSRSRSRSRKHRYSSRSRSRSRSHSASHGRDRNYPREHQNNRGYQRGYNRGYRRPFYYRGRGRGFFPRGRYQRGGGGGGYGYGGYRPNNWQNQRGQQQYEQDAHSPRRGRSRSRSRSSRRRSASPRSRSRSRASDRSSSRHWRRSSSSSSSSRSSSPRAKRSTKEPKQGSSERREPAGADYSSTQLRSAVVVSQGPAGGSQAPPPPAAPSSGASGWKSISPAPASRSPPLPGPGPAASGFGFFSKEEHKGGEKAAISSAFKKFLAEHQTKKGSEWDNDPSHSEGNARKAPTYPEGEQSDEPRPRPRVKERGLEDEPKAKAKPAALGRGPLDEGFGAWAGPTPHSSAKDVPRAEEERNDLEDMQEELYASRKLERAAAARREQDWPSPDRPHKAKRKERSAFSPPHTKWEEEDFSSAASSARYDVPCSSDVLTKERRLARDLVHPGKDSREFRSIFQHVQATQFRRSPSELFAQHIVTIVHHIKAQHFPSPEMTLSERFALYQHRAVEKEMRPRKSPEIHRRIDISPSAFKKYSHLFEDVKNSEDAGFKDVERLARKDAQDTWPNAEQRGSYGAREREHRHAGREAANSPGSSEKPSKHHKKSKKSKKKRSRSRSSSSSSRSARAPERPAQESHPADEGLGRSYPVPSQHGTAEERGRNPGVFQFKIWDKGWNRGGYTRSHSNGNPPATDAPGRAEEEWDPEYTPKSRKYYLHDDRGGDRKWMNQGNRGRGTFTHGRGQFPGARGGFMYPKGSGSPKWAHDKFQSGEEEGELQEEEGELGPQEGEP